LFSSFNIFFSLISSSSSFFISPSSFFLLLVRIQHRESERERTGEIRESRDEMRQRERKSQRSGERKVAERERETEPGRRPRPEARIPMGRRRANGVVQQSRTRFRRGRVIFGGTQTQLPANP
jgi:hypothetical protein